MHEAITLLFVTLPNIHRLKKIPLTHSAINLSLDTGWATRGWRRGVMVTGVRRMNEVNARRARLVPEWVTVFGRVYHLGM